MAIKGQFKILLFEKDENVGQLLCDFMHVGEFHVDMFTEPEEAFQAFKTGQYSICIINLDNASLDEDFAFAKGIKEVSPDVILIFLGTNPTIETLTQAYALEADDFIRKPFILEELQMRINAIIRRSRGVMIHTSSIYQIGKYVFDAKKQSLYYDDVCKKITTKECELLQYLCENMNNLVVRKDVLRTVWRNSTYYNARSMDVYITKLRRLLKDDNRVGIINVHGKGYKLLVI